MFAKKLSPLIHSYPQEAIALERMANYLEDFESRRGRDIYKIRLDPNRMFDIMQAGNSSRLAILTSILIDENIFRREIVVRFPSGNGISFSSYNEIPLFIKDPVIDIEVEVNFDQIEPSYVLVKDEHN